MVDRSVLSLVVNTKKCYSGNILILYIKRMSLDCPQLKLFAQINQLWNKLFERPCFKCRAIEPDISSAVVYIVDWAALDAFPPYNFALVDKNRRF